MRPLAESIPLLNLHFRFRARLHARDRLPAAADDEPHQAIWHFYLLFQHLVPIHIHASTVLLLDGGLGPNGFVVLLTLLIVGIVVLVLPPGLLFVLPPVVFILVWLDP